MLETKLAPPYRRVGIIPRPRVVDRLAAAEAPALAILAPAGYGKSIALAQWAETSPRPFAWLSLDERDSDPACLLRGIAAAIDRVAPLDGSTIDTVVGPGPSVWTTAVTRLGAAIAERSPLTLVLDDIDRLGDDAVAVVVNLIDSIRGGTRLALAGRAAGRVPVARMVSRGQLVQFGSQDLALDQSETIRVAAAGGLQLTADEGRDLCDRTEGWATGVYLSSLSRRSGGGSAAAALSPQAPERLIEEYLRSELLATLGPEDASLVLHCAALERVSGALADALLESSGSGMALDRLERANLFVIALDRERTWFRLHHLVGDLLRAELQRREPDALDRIRRDAAAWHAANGLLSPAMEYAIAAGDEEMAVRILAELASGPFEASDWATLRRWLRWIDERGAGARHPELAAFAATAFALGGDAQAADRWAELAERKVVGRGGSTDAPNLAVSRAVLCRHGPDQMLADAEAAVRMTTDSDPWRTSAITASGISRVLRGEIADGAARLEEAVVRSTRRREASSAGAIARVHLAVLALDRGDRQAAEGHVRQARSVVATAGLGEQGTAAMVDAVSARISVLHGAVEQAQTDVTHAQRLRPLLTHALPWMAVRARLDLIRVQIALADGGGARTLLAEVRDILARRPHLGTLVAETDDMDERVRALRGGIVSSSTLTLAELRLLPLLTTHLSFREIGSRLYVSQNTVKTQAISIYRKLEATSRGEAVERAIAIGLLDRVPTNEPFIQSG